jgi:hypothetical protein
MLNKFGVPGSNPGKWLIFGLATLLAACANHQANRAAAPTQKPATTVVDCSTLPFQAPFTVNQSACKTSEARISKPADTMAPVKSNTPSVVLGLQVRQFRNATVFNRVMAITTDGAWGFEQHSLQTLGKRFMPKDMHHTFNWGATAKGTKGDVRYTEQFFNYQSPQNLAFWNCIGFAVYSDPLKALNSTTVYRKGQGGSFCALNKTNAELRALFVEQNLPKL